MPHWKQLGYTIELDYTIELGYTVETVKGILNSHAILIYQIFCSFIAWCALFFGMISVTERAGQPFPLQSSDQGGCRPTTTLAVFLTLTVLVTTIDTLEHFETG